MFTYIKNLYSQIKKIYNIKKQLNIILEDFTKEIPVDVAIKNFNALRNMIFDCGSLYVKFLQWYISKLKSSILDNDTLETKNILNFVEYFEDIFENCPFHSLEYTKEIFKNSMFGIELENYVDIKTFKEIASGSIGQIYYAKRKTDGIEIAIKVKHPDITTDLKNQLELLKILRYLQSFKFIRKYFNLIFNIDDFLNDINNQCDFNNEANNAIQFRENFKDSREMIVFPEVKYQSEDILISEYIPGFPIETLTPTQQYQATLNFVSFFYQMFLVDNFIHGDLHCKNWKVRINEKGFPQLVIYDFGICFKNIDVETNREFWFSISKYDIHKMTTIFKKFIIKSNNNNIGDEIISNEIKRIFDVILKDCLGTSVLLKLIIHFFTTHNILVDKFILNFSILICLVEEFLKKGNMIDREKKNHDVVSMFDIINDITLDILAFCEVKKCYPKVKELFEKETEIKYNEYRQNLLTHNIQENKRNNEPELFTIIKLSGLTFKPPE